MSTNSTLKVQGALPSLRESKGRIVIVSSGAAINAYSTWGSYGSSKAAVNHLVATLANEEQTVTAISIRPGVVDTEMQQDIREKHHSVMDEEDRKKFLELKAEGKLLRPEQPGNVISVSDHTQSKLSRCGLIHELRRCFYEGKQ